MSSLSNGLLNFQPLVELLNNLGMTTSVRPLFDCLVQQRGPDMGTPCTTAVGFKTLL